MGHLNKVARFLRIGKVYKLIRMTKIFRFIKLVKVNNKYAKQLTELLKIGEGTERLILMLITFMVLTHVTACLW